MECAREIFPKLVSSDSTCQVPPGPLLHSLLLQERSSAAGPSAGGWGCQGGRGHLGPARPAGQPAPSLSPGLSSPRPEGSRSQRGGGDGAANAPHLREGTSRALILRDPACPGLGEAVGIGSPILPARRPPRPLHAAAAVGSLAGAGARAPRGPPTLAPASSAPFSSFPPPAAGLERGAPPTPGRARREGGDCGEGGAPPAARLPGPGARVAPEPPAPRGDSQRSAPRPDSAGSARRAGGPEDAGGLPRPPPALPPGRAPSAPLAAPPPRGREGGVRPRSEPQPRRRAPPDFPAPAAAFLLRPGARGC